MKANELRLGNWVTLKQKYLPRQATHINESVLTATNIGHQYHMWKSIPLTEEWLIKFGFEKIEDKRYRIKVDAHNTWIDIYWYSYIATGDNIQGWDIQHIHNEVNYSDEPPRKHYEVKDDIFMKGLIEAVHQLQNLYFALTNEELEIK